MKESFYLVSPDLPQNFVENVNGLKRLLQSLIFIPYHLYPNLMTIFCKHGQVIHFGLILEPLC